MFFQAESSMTGIEVLTQVWLKMREILDKQVKKNLKNLPGFMQAHKKCAMKMKKETRKNSCVYKMFLMEGSGL